MSQKKFCPNCDQNVTIIQEAGNKSGCIVATLLLILGLIIPLWPITLPICWVTAFVVAIATNRKPPLSCPICRTPAAELSVPR